MDTTESAREVQSEDLTGDLRRQGTKTARIGEPLADEMTGIGEMLLRLLLMAVPEQSRFDYSLTTRP